MSPFRTSQHGDSYPVRGGYHFCCAERTESRPWEEKRYHVVSVFVEYSEFHPLTAGYCYADLEGPETVRVQGHIWGYGQDLQCL